MSNASAARNAFAAATAEQRNRLRTLDLLISRRSTGALTEPAPQAAELDLILEAGLHVPDHGRLRPWRFVLIRGEARTAFGECLADAVKARDRAAPPALLDRYQAWTLRNSLLIAVGVRIRSGHPVPEVEQVLSTGAAAMNMLNAIHLLGYAGIWVTGANAYDARVNEALGFRAPNKLVGFLAVGTPVNVPEPVPASQRPDRSAHVFEWSAPTAG